MFKVKFRNCLIFLLLTITPSIHGQDLNRYSAYRNIMDTNLLRIGISMHYPPLNYDSGKRGVEIIMARELGKFLSVTVKLVPMTVNEYVTAITENKVDIIIAGFSRNLKRAKKIWFSIPYITMTPAVLALKQSIPRTKFGDEFEQNPIKTIWDLENISNFKFAVKKGSSYEQLLKDKMTGIRKVLIDTNVDGLNLLKKRKVDGFVHDSLYLEYIYENSAKYKRSYVLLKGGSQTEKICIGLPFGDVILKNQVDTFISELKREGYIDKWLKIYNKN